MYHTMHLWLVRRHVVVFCFWSGCSFWRITWDGAGGLWIRMRWRFGRGILQHTKYLYAADVKIKLESQVTLATDWTLSSDHHHGIFCCLALLLMILYVWPRRMCAQFCSANPSWCAMSLAVQCILSQYILVLELIPSSVKWQPPTEDSLSALGSRHWWTLTDVEVFIPSDLAFLTELVLQKLSYHQSVIPRLEKLCS